MGIDVYLQWDNQTEQEKELQYTGFDTTMGYVGYLREAYHGGPYATKYLFNRDWDKQPDSIFTFTSEELWNNLPIAVTVVTLREQKIYNNSIGSPERVKAFIDFVRFHEKLEKEGKNPKVLISY